jgi:hypothetical protein
MAAATRHFTVQPPIVLFRSERRGAPWMCGPDLAHATVMDRLAVQGRTEADACHGDAAGV